MKLIRTEQEYEEALDRMNLIFDSKPSSKEGQEAELLALLIEDYEDIHYQIPSPDPIAAIRRRMEELELKQRTI
jgi:HTH-type transcriptional regulator/antitoxin HigA